jgi:glutamate racemase
MATTATIDSGRYKDWGVDIYPVKCPKIVPLLESAKLSEAKQEWQAYLSELPNSINDVIIGCTHYSFLIEPEARSQKLKAFNFINPAKLVLEQFSGSVFNDGIINYADDRKKELDINLHFTKASEEYLNLATELLDLE